MTVKLTNNSHKSMIIRRGSEIRCLEGVLWITQDGDIQDHIVTAGEKFIANRKGKVVLQALNTSSTFSVN